MRFIRITRQNLSQWQPGLEALEATSLYPLGDDAFRISHGDNYLGFFERLGDVAYYALVDDDGLAAVACGALRPAGRGLPARWYIGDLKVRLDARGRHLPVSLIRRAFVQNYLRCPRGYAVAMNPADGRVPPAVRAFAHFRWLPPSMLGTLQLDLFAADHDGLRAVWPTLVAARGPAHLVNVAGIKALRLQSTGEALPLLHVRHGVSQAGDVVVESRPGHTHMWCVPRDTPLCTTLREQGHVPMASATVVHHRLEGLDWSSIDTSEI